MHEPKPESRLVVAVIATNAEVGRAEMRGIEGAAALAGWTLETIDPAQTGPDLALFASLLVRADGVIIREPEHLANAAPLLRPETPVVQLDGIHPRAAVRIKCDVGGIADVAAGELLRLGRKCHVFIPMPRAWHWTNKRAEAFLSRVRTAGCEAVCYEPQTERGWSKEREALATWLSTLPRPMAIFAGNDFLAKFALAACRDAGLDVPGDAAILGADDDETLCLSTTPTLSSIRMDFEGAGRMAVERLAALMDAGVRASSPRRGESRRPGGGIRGQDACAPAAVRRQDGDSPSQRAPKPIVVRYGTLGVARRGSTREITPGTDLRMAAGLDFIATHYTDPFIGVRDVAAAMGTSRRQAERLFHSQGKSIREHIEEIRLSRVRVLLKTTTMPLRAIAEECGFVSRPYLAFVFHRRFGKTPGGWRGEMRGR